jgi:hypothetical protein
MFTKKSSTRSRRIRPQRELLLRLRGGRAGRREAAQAASASSAAAAQAIATTPNAVPVSGTAAASADPRDGAMRRPSMPFSPSAACAQAHGALAIDGELVDAVQR